MNIELLSSDITLQEIITELFPDTPGSDTLAVDTIHSEANGFTASYDQANRKLRIEYHRIQDLLRAILISKSRIDLHPEESFSLSETLSFDELGFMVDCSRNAVITIPALKRLIRLLAPMGYTFIGLYTEDTIEVEGEPYFGYQRGRLTAEEIREADAYAHRFGMELRPYIQTLAHLNQIVRYADYSGIVDTDDILLVDEPRTLELIDHLLASVSDAYQTRKINIGMDEAHMVGLGRYLDLHGYTDRTQIMLRHLSAVMKLCAKYGFEPEMWSDMFFRLAFHGEYYISDDGNSSESALPDISVPAGLTLTYWDYYSQDQQRYEQMLNMHRRITDRIAFAGGAWKWMGFAPLNRFSIRNTAAAMAACRAQKIASAVITGWGDDGAECSVFAVLPALYLSAKFAYCPDAAAKAARTDTISDMYDSDDNQIFSSLTGYSLDEFLTLDDTNPGAGTGRECATASKEFLYSDLLLGTFDGVASPKTTAHFADTADRLRRILDSSRCADPAAGRPFDDLFKTQLHLCEVLALKAGLGSQLRSAYQSGDRETLRVIADEVLPELLEKLSAFYIDFRKQWLGCSSSFGFEVQTIRLGGLRQRLEDCILILHEYLDGDTDRIRELESPCLPMGYPVNSLDPEKLDMNNYVKTVTTARIGWGY